MLSPTSLSILAAWVATGLVLIGLGLGCLRLCRAQPEGTDGILLSFWTGWICLLFVLQIWHLFLPVDARTSGVIAIAGIAGLILQGRRPFFDLLRRIPRSWIALVLFALISVWLADRALIGARHGDSGLYHIPTVLWLSEYPVVPGLGNLYAAFAMNQSHFLYVAVLDVGPFEGRAHHLANGLLILALFAHVLLSIQRLLRWRGRVAPQDVFYAMLAAPAIYLAFGILLTSPSPDLPVFVLGIVVSGQLIALLSRTQSRTGVSPDLVAIVLIAVGGLTVKLSFAGLAATIIPVSIGLWLWRARPSRRSLGLTFAVTAIVVGIGVMPWIARNVVLSGCPFYPSTFASVPVEWRVPGDISESIKQWNRLGAPLSIAISDPRWFLRKLESLGWVRTEVTVPLMIAAAALLLNLSLLFSRSWRTRSSPLSLFIFLPTIGSLVFCFVNAPLPRFAGAVFWLLASQSLVLVLGSTPPLGNRWVRALGVTLSLAVASLFIQTPLTSGIRDFQPMARPAVSEHELEPGLIVKIPERTSQCWAEPLPCAPFLEPQLRLRQPGNLGSGFKMLAGDRPE